MEFVLMILAFINSIFGSPTPATPAPQMAIVQQQTPAQINAAANINDSSSDLSAKATKVKKGKAAKVKKAKAAKVAKVKTPKEKKAPATKKVKQFNYNKPLKFPTSSWSLEVANIQVLH